ncbi:PHP domain-containing protein [Salisediminibacterium beveridgei]|uniref:Putative metal-dependent phosphoesterase, PHP family n=1 Tax=Salisediminibacterium beveridgei TaxID=632773 RepID=A0A1D7QVL9_9BACI|nr:PHP domain-containing protein [Salisediminibacterium beveridgei]AOM83064.1 putative metal-dependent phosphoesterase, PHP family [Salisediminibacterium beveridgei]
MNKPLADLHMHSTASDGAYSQVELVSKAAAAGLTMISLTDHDTTTGLASASETAKKLGLDFINGLELSTRFCKTSVDILGYGVQPDCTALQKTLAFHRERRLERMRTMIRKCQDQGIRIEETDVFQYVTGDTYSRPHLAKALVDHGYADTVGDAFKRYIGYNGPCYAFKEDEMHPEEAIRVIHEAGGVAIIAHPVFYDLDEEIPALFHDYNLDGIEVFHRDHDAKTVERFSCLANRIETSLGHAIFKTGGSDFHHESFGREGEELGLTKLPFEEANRLFKTVTGNTPENY